MSQTVISAGGQAIGVAGQVADSAHQDIVSGFNKEAAKQIPFGHGVRVQPGSNGDGFLLATGFSGSQGLGFDVAGVNVFSFNHMRLTGPDAAGNYAGDIGSSGANGPAGLVANAGMQVLRRGRILVPVEADVVAGDRPWCRGIATGVTAGQFAGTWAGTGYNVAGAGSSYMLDVTKCGVFRSNSYTAADGTTRVAILEVDFTSKP